MKNGLSDQCSPNLNAYAERFIRSNRQECLDWFIIFTEKQLRNIIKQYLEYYNFVVLVRLVVEYDQNNKFRPHQGLGVIPEGKPGESLFLCFLLIIDSKY